MSKHDRWGMEDAAHYARRSKDSTQVGCAIHGPHGEVRAQGWNGIPRGVRDDAGRMERPHKYLWTVHAEANAVANAARHGASLHGCTAYVTHHPCAQCAALLVQCGVRRVVVGSGTTSMPEEQFIVAEIMFAEAGVGVEYAKVSPRLVP